MSRRVRQRVDEDVKNKVNPPSHLVTVRDEDVAAQMVQVFVDWTSLTHDTVLHVFTLLNYRDRASLASTCRTWRSLGASSCLWTSLDLRDHNFDFSTASALANRCAALHKVRFQGLDVSASLGRIGAKNVREVTGESCENMTNATLSLIAARHHDLESLQLGPGSCDNISGEAIKFISLCCPKLKKIRLFGIKDVTTEAIESLAERCPQLSDVGFVYCLNIDEEAVGKVVSIRYLSVAGTKNIDWKIAVKSWKKLPGLTGLDVSRTDIDQKSVSELLFSSPSLKVVCAFDCPLLPEGITSRPDDDGLGDRLLLAVFNSTLIGVHYLLNNLVKIPNDIFAYWRNVISKEKTVDETMLWTERILSQALLKMAEKNSQCLNSFWLSDGTMLLLRLLQSSQEDVQERAATGLAKTILVDDYNGRIDNERAEAVVKEGGIQILVNLAKSLKEGFQIEVTKAIANLSLNAKAAKAVVEGGGIIVLVDLAKSKNKVVADEAACGLWNLSMGDAYKAIAEAGGVIVLLELLSRWPNGCGFVERAAGAIANLAADDKCSIEVAKAKGIHALVTLAKNSTCKETLEQTCRALANMASHGDDNNNNAEIGKEPGVFEALLQQMKSRYGTVRKEAACALWNLSYDNKNRDLIAAAGGVEDLVAHVKFCLSIPMGGLQQRTAGALWGLSISEEHGIAIGNEGGIPPLLALAKSPDEEVHQTAAGALWSLSFNHGNALRIVEEGGVTALIHLCTTSSSKTARFMAALTLSYIFDGRMDKRIREINGSRSASLSKAKTSALKHIESFVTTFMSPQFFAAATALSSTPSMLAQVAVSVRIEEAGELRCSAAEIGRFVTMLRNRSPILKCFAAFALVQFTVPEGRHAMHHASLMQNVETVLRSAAAATIMPFEGRIFAKIVLRNLQQHHKAECSSSEGKKALSS